MKKRKLIQKTFDSWVIGGKKHGNGQPNQNFQEANNNKNEVCNSNPIDIDITPNSPLLVNAVSDIRISSGDKPIVKNNSTVNRENITNKTKTVSYSDHMYFNHEDINERIMEEAVDDPEEIVSENELNVGSKEKTSTKSNHTNKKSSTNLSKSGNNSAEQCGGIIGTVMEEAVDDPKSIEQINSEEELDMVSKEKDSAKSHRTKKNSSAKLSKPGNKFAEKGGNHKSATNKEKKQNRKQSFCDDWLLQPSFRGWLEKHKTKKYLAKCKLCDKNLVTAKTVLLRHSRTSSHKNNAAAIANTVQMTNENLQSNKINNHKTQVKISEIRHALYVAEHDLSFKSVNHLHALAKECFSGNEVAKSMKLQETKCKNIIVNVVDATVIDSLKKDLKNQHYSVQLDETTDVSNFKNLQILVRYIHNHKVRTSLLNLVRMVKGATAVAIFEEFQNCLNEFDLDINNIVGACTDNCNVMVGDHESFKVKLLQKNENLIYVGCVCHLAHLVAKEATGTLPVHLEQLMCDISSYFSRSAERQNYLEEQQAFMREKRHKILKRSDTRWLAISDCVVRILEQWEVLKQIFTFGQFREMEKDDNKQKCTNILNQLKNPYNKAYFQFLAFILPRFNSFNKAFQTNDILIHDISGKCLRFLRVICSYYLKPESYAGDKLASVQYRDPKNLLDIQKINIGADAEETIKTLDPTHNTQFRLVCLHFYQKTTQGIISRFPVKNNFLSEIAFLDVNNALEVKNRITINNIAKKFSHRVNANAAINEWNLLPSYLSDTEKKEYKELEIVRFWEKMMVLQDEDKQPLFRNIAQLALICLIIPHSNAYVETVFSMLKNIKTKIRNRMITKTIGSLLRVKLELKKENKNCYNYPISGEMLKKFNTVDMYKKDPGFSSSEDEEE